MVKQRSSYQQHLLCAEQLAQFSSTLTVKLIHLNEVFFLMLMKNTLYLGIVLLCIAGCSKNNTQSHPPAPPPTYNVNAITDVQYGQNTTYAGDNQKLLLDIYSPKDASASKKYPLVVMAHGGSFIDGNKDNLSDLCQAIAEKGYIAVSIDYRLGWNYGNIISPVACTGDTISLQKALYRSLQDYNAALRFLIHDADKYFIDTSWIFTGGGSAGAVAAINTTYVTPDFTNTYFKDEKAQLGGLKTADNNLTDVFAIKADISLWGAVITPDLITSSTAVPMVAFHGSADETVPILNDHYSLCPDYPVLYGSEYIYNILTSLGVPAALHIAEGEGHGPEIYQDPDFVATNTNCFLKSLMNKKPITGTFENKDSGCQ